MYQVSTGGGTALVSQYRERGLFRITSLVSPAFPVFSMLPASQIFRKLGGTVTNGEKRMRHYQYIAVTKQVGDRGMATLGARPEGGAM